MKKRIRIISVIIIGVILVMVIGCSKLFKETEAEDVARSVEIITYQNDASMKKVYDLQSGDMINLFISPDSKFVVSLPDEDSGYSWNMTHPAGADSVEYYDTSWVMSESQQYDEMKQEDRRQNLFFKANNLGDDMVKMEYMKKDDETICFNFDIRIQVEDLQMKF